MTAPARPSSSSTSDSVSGAPTQRLSFDATVPRHLVHRSSVAEVFVTDSAALGDIGPSVETSDFEVAAQLPRGHIVRDGAPVYDFLLLVEVLRQAGVLVAHRHLEVPLDQKFIFSALRFTTLDLAALQIGARPANALISMTVRPERNRAGRVQGFEFTGQLALDDRPALEASGALAFVSPRAFSMLRGKSRTDRVPAQSKVPQLLPAPAAAVGRRNQDNVVLTEPSVDENGRAAAQLVVDVNHPHLFDHALDHVPGNLQLEAARQLAVAAVARSLGLPAVSLVVTRVAATFQEFAELDLLTRVTGRVLPFRHDEELQALVVTVEVTLSQNGTAVSQVTVEVAQ